MRKNARPISALTACLMALALLVVTGFPSSANSGRVEAGAPQAGSIETKTITAAAATLTLIKSTPTSFEFKLHDPARKGGEIAHGEVIFTDYNLSLRMEESGGRVTEVMLQRRNDTDVAVWLKTGNVSTEMVIGNVKQAIFGNDPAKAGVVLTDGKQYESYLKEAAQSHALGALHALFTADLEGVATDGAARTLSRLVRIARGNAAIAAPSASSTSTSSCCCEGDAEINFMLCMRWGGNPVTCFWDSVIFLIVCMIM